jgi:hypothetical protein
MPGRPACRKGPSATLAPLHPLYCLPCRVPFPRDAASRRVPAPAQDFPVGYLPPGLRRAFFAEGALTSIRSFSILATPAAGDCQLQVAGLSAILRRGGDRSYLHRLSGRRGIITRPKFPADCRRPSGGPAPWGFPKISPQSTSLPSGPLGSPALDGPPARPRGLPASAACRVSCPAAVPDATRSRAVPSA